MEKPNDLPIAKKHKSMDSDDEEPQNEPGTSSTSQPFVPMLPLNQGPAASSQGPTASAISDNENRGYSDENCVRSQDSERTVLYHDLHILMNTGQGRLKHTSMQLQLGHSVLSPLKKGKSSIFASWSLCHV